MGKKVSEVSEVARGIINMVNEYNRVIRAKDHEIICYKDDINYLKQKADVYENTLGTVKSIIRKNINTTKDGDHYINMWDCFVGDYKKLMDLLDIVIDEPAEPAEREVK